MAQQTIDLETRLSSDDHIALRLWLRLLTCSSLVETSIRRRLQRQFSLTLPRFDLLAQLDRVDGLKMSELSRRLMVTSGNVTGIADQLERDGWLTRESDSDDRRATRLRLTVSGRERFRAMARVHETWIIELMSSLDSTEQRELQRLLGKLKQSASRTDTKPALEAGRPAIQKEQR
ncbi:MAG: MarR family transcriptional regulator [Gammaproteobacteria bacterium]